MDLLRDPITLEAKCINMESQIQILFVSKYSHFLVFNYQLDLQAAFQSRELLYTSRCTYTSLMTTLKLSDTNHQYHLEVADFFSYLIPNEWVFMLKLI